jgi:hypothetical protein
LLISNLENFPLIDVSDGQVGVVGGSTALHPIGFKHAWSDRKISQADAEFNGDRDAFKAVLIDFGNPERVLSCPSVESHRSIFVTGAIVMTGRCEIFVGCA